VCASLTHAAHNRIIQRAQRAQFPTLLLHAPHSATPPPTSLLLFSNGSGETAPGTSTVLLENVSFNTLDSDLKVIPVPRVPCAV
jgi:hypothetical protein